MPKSRLSALDVRACVNELKGKVLGAKVFNVYDVSNKIYIIKAIKNGVQYNILLESGVRIHTTSYLREKSSFPNTFSQKLRKHIRERRIEAIRQIGFDRIIDIVFGNGENTYHLILELYSGGNLILTNYEFEIMALLRTYKLADGSEVNVNQRYNYEPRQQSPFDELEKLSVDSLKEYVSLYLSRWNNLKAKEKSMRYILLSNHLLSLLGSIFVQNVLTSLHWNNLTTEETEQYLHDDASLSQLVDCIKQQVKLVQDSIQSPHGYIVANRDDIISEGKVVCKDYQDFAPFSVIPVTEEMLIHDYASFLDCVDHYFINDENYRVYLEFQKSKEQANKRVDTIAHKQNSRIADITKQLHLIEKRIHCLITNSTIVNTAILIINQFLSQGIQWTMLKDQVDQYKKKPYNIFHHIDSLDLDHNRIRLSLPNMSMDDDDEEMDEDGDEEMEDEDDTTLLIDVELSMNCNNNIELLYKQKKEMEVKLDKTLQAAEQAIQEASKQRDKEIIKTEKHQASEIVKKRQKKWFEKFDWFLTSESYIVIAGKSGDQNELLVKKYLRKDDIFMHADVPGAASVIIRNYLGGTARNSISEISLQQAAVFALCHSSSWDNNMVNKVYWVNASQVSKNSPTGEALPSGSFMIRGKKNYLSPYRLEMGIGLFFEIGNDASKHMYERHRRDMSEEEWSYLIEKGVLQTTEQEKTLTNLETILTENVAVDDIDDDEYTIEVMDSVVNTSKKAKTVSKSHPVQPSKKKNEPASSNKKSLKGTTKKSRAAAEEEEEMNALIQEEDEKNKVKQPSRGEKRKMKKMKKQSKMDDEEAKLLSILYGHSSIDDIVDKEKKKQPTKKNEPEKEPVAIVPELPSEIDLLMNELLEAPEEEEEKPSMFCYTCGSHNHLQETCPESWRVIEHVDSCMKEETPAPSETPAEEVEEESINEKNEDLLLSWTTQPNEEDEIIHAIPVCAPYAAIADYRYHVKLTAGKMKKGAISRAIVDHWLKERMSEGERKAIKQMSIDDLISVIMNNAKVTVGSSSKGKK